MVRDYALDVSGLLVPRSAVQREAISAAKVWETVAMERSELALQTRTLARACTGGASIPSGTQCASSINGHLQCPLARSLHHASGTDRHAAAGVGHYEDPQFVEAAPYSLRTRARFKKMSIAKSIT